MCMTPARDIGGGRGGGGWIPGTALIRADPNPNTGIYRTFNKQHTEDLDPITKSNHASGRHCVRQICVDLHRAGGWAVPITAGDHKHVSGWPRPAKMDPDAQPYLCPPPILRLMLLASGLSHSLADALPLAAAPLGPTSPRQDLPAQGSSLPRALLCPDLKEASV